MKYNLLTIFLCTVCLSCNGQGPALLFSRQHPVTSDSLGVIKKIKSPPFGENLKVIYGDGQKRKVLKNDLWGFQGSNGRLYRIYDNKVFRVIRQGSIVKYERRLAGTNQYQWRFSSDLDSPLFQTRKKARVQQEGQMGPASRE